MSGRIKNCRAAAYLNQWIEKDAADRASHPWRYVVYELDK